MAQKIVPEAGRTYKNRNGDNYMCMAVEDNGPAVMERVSDGWTLRAHGICQYEDGTIEWDYSGGGHWTRERGRNLCG